MKKILNLFMIIFILSIFNACKSNVYVGSYGQVNQTQVVLSNNNFKVLGSFTGTAFVKKRTISIKNKEGLIALAKKHLLENAKKAGVELKGSRTLINVATDIIDNGVKLKAVMTAEIIEFK